MLILILLRRIVQKDMIIHPKILIDGMECDFAESVEIPGENQ